MRHTLCPNMHLRFIFIFHLVIYRVKSMTGCISSTSCVLLTHSGVSLHMFQKIRIAFKTGIYNTFTQYVK